METKARFELGELVLTPNARDQIGPEDLDQALARHARGDWGEVCPADWRKNERSLQKGYALVSLYRSRNGRSFWIFTEPDRSATAVIVAVDC